VKYYNQKTEIPISVTHLIFGDEYNQVTILPNSIISHNLKKIIYNNLSILIANYSNHLLQTLFKIMPIIYLISLISYTII